MNTTSSSRIRRRLARLLPLAAAALTLSSCTTGPMDRVAFGSGYDSAPGALAGRGYDRDGSSHDGGWGRGPGVHAGHEGSPERSDLPGRGSLPGGSGGFWTGPLPWPDGLARPDGGGSTTIFRDPGLRLADPSLAGRLRPDPRGFEAGRIRPEVRILNPEVLRASLRPAPRPADRLRESPDLTLSPVAPGSLRLAAPAPAAASRLRVDPAMLRPFRLSGVTGLRTAP